MNDLIIKDMSAAVVFTAKGLDSVLADITAEVKSIVPDVTTTKGRKEITSLAHKVAKSKTALDALGKDLVSEWKSKAKLVDADRKKSRDYLDALRDEVRAPLDAWEKEEAIKLAIEEAKIAKEYDHAEAITINDALIKEADLVERERVIAEKEWVIERERVAKQLAENEQKRLASAKSEADLDARYQEDLRIEEKRKAIEQATADAQAQIDEANALAQQAEQRRLDQEREAKEAAEKLERDRLQKEAAEKAEVEKRERNTRHKGSINSRIVEQLMKIGMDKDLAKKAVKAIVKGSIDNVKINY
jgi:colicin import membrane protein